MRPTEEEESQRAYGRFEKKVIAPPFFTKLGGGRTRREICTAQEAVCRVIAGKAVRSGARGISQELPALGFPKPIGEELDF